MQKKIVITGISGFAGSHLASYLLERGNYDIYGTYLSEHSLTSIEPIKSSLHLSQIDLSHGDSVYEYIHSLAPDMIFHLAALTSPGDSFTYPSETITNNIGIEINILEAVKNAGLTNTKILIVSSADVYGMVSAHDIPIDEETKFMPTNPYAVSKIAQDYLGLQYFLSYHLPIIRVRPFNHIGPGQSSHFAISAFAKRIAEAEKGKGEAVLGVGNLDAKRDFTDVRDIVRAYELAIEKGAAGEVYNIGSGVSYKVGDILQKLISMASVPLKVETDPTLLRPSDTPLLQADVTKFTQLTGWKPSIPLETSLKDTLDYWRQIV